MSAAATHCITTESLSKRFNREWVFRHLTTSFTSNFYALTGPNGSGKSTLLHLLWGQVPPTTGSVKHIVDGKPIDIQRLPQFISIAAPYMDLIEEFTLEEHLKFHFSLKPIRPGHTLDTLIDICYLGDSRKKHIKNFSSGMKQRLKLGLAFYTEVPFLFLDEPGSHLDERAFKWYRTELEKLPPGKVVLIGSNNPDEYPAETQQMTLLNYK